MARPNIENAIGRIQNLPTLPTVLSKILATAADPDASALDLGEHIQADQSLSASLLKVVNSAYYGFYRQISSVTHAIVVLGFIEVRNMTLAATAFRTLGNDNSDFDRTQLWRHSLATALAAERLATRTRMKSEGVFEAGLLHDIGKVVLDILYPERFEEAAHEAHQREVLIWQVEREFFGLDHAGAGGILGEHWNLPPSVVDAIRNHHAPEASKESPKLTAVTTVADYIATHAGLAERSNGRLPDYPEYAAQLLGLDAEALDAVGEDLRAQETKIDDLLGCLRRR